MPRGEQHRFYVPTVSDFDTTGHDATLATFYETLIQHGRLTIPNFGSFRVKRKRAFKAHNNIVGKVIEIGGKCTVSFTPSPKLKAAVRSAK